MARRKFPPRRLASRSFHLGKQKLGKFGETISEKVLETVFLGSKTGKNSDFLRSQFASDSVIRWFESSYPSQRPYILWYPIEQSQDIVPLFFERSIFRPYCGEICGVNCGVKILNRGIGRGFRVAFGLFDLRWWNRKKPRSKALFGRNKRRRSLTWEREKRCLCACGFISIKQKSRTEGHLHRGSFDILK